MKKNRDASKNSVSTLKKAKTIELIIVLLIGIAYFCILMSSRVLRTAVFTNHMIFTLSVLIWAVLIIFLVSMLLDFHMLRGAADRSSELTQTAYVDSLTGLPNRLSVDMMLDKYNSDRSLTGVGCAVLQLSNLIGINGRYNHEVGDSLIRDFCVILKDVGSSYGFVGRNSGNEFIAVFEACDAELITQFIADMYVAVNLYNLSHTETPIEFEYAYALNSENPSMHMSDLLTVAYRNLEENPLT